MFTDRFGLTGKRPRGLGTMPVFVNDSPDPEWTGGDLVLQVCSNASDSVHHALRELTRATRGMMQLEWKILGFHSGPRPTGAPRNLFGYEDGIVNPSEDEDLVWIDKDSGQPDWAVGGTFMVVRLPMTDYIQPYGGGYFVVPPGVAEFGGYLGQGLFT